MEQIHTFVPKRIDECFDLIVAGGGLAGTMAAVAAARRGLRVLLIERYGALGGMATIGLVNPIMHYHERGENGKIVNEGLFGEMLDRLYAAGGCRAPRPKYFIEELLKLVLDRMVCEAGVKVLFHAQLSAVAREGETIRSVTVSTISGNIELRARYFIDATGNADLAAFGGLGYFLGREADGLCQAMTLFCRLGNVDWDRFSAEEAQRKFRALRESGQTCNPRDKLLLFHLPLEHLMHFNSTMIQGKNPVDVEDLTEAEFIGRTQVEELYHFMREQVGGMEACQLLQTAVEVGIRESRRIAGRYVMTADDILGTVHFPDSIAQGAYCIDIHSPTASGEIVVHRLPEHTHYTIPYRSLLPEHCENLLIAGRPISATHEAHAAIRIMPIVACIGEGAGTACAVAARHDVKLSAVDVEEVQRELTAAGALI